MGIDAVIIVKPSTRVEECELQKLSWRVCDMFEPESFCKVKNIFYREGDNLVLSSLKWRYYGEGYHRGPLYKIIALLDAIKELFPGASIYYRPENSFAEEIEYTPESRAAMWSEFVEHGHRDWFGFDENHPCPKCGCPMYETIRDAKKAFACRGCGHNEQSVVLTSPADTL